MTSRAASQRSFRLMLVYQVSQHTPLYWPYMFYFTTAVRGLPASDFTRGTVVPLYAGQPNITASKKKKTWTTR